MTLTFLVFSEKSKSWLWLDLNWWLAAQVCNQASPKSQVPLTQNSNILTQRVKPNRPATYPSVVAQNIPQADRSPPFSPILLIPGNEYAPCQIPACKSTKTFEGSRGLKVRASVAHPNYTSKMVKRDLYQNYRMNKWMKKQNELRAIFY